MPLGVFMEVSALNGMHLARVEHKTAPLALLLSGNHRESISFHIIDSPQPRWCWVTPGSISTTRASSGRRAGFPPGAPTANQTAITNLELCSTNNALYRCHHIAPTTALSTCSRVRRCPAVGCSTSPGLSRRLWRSTSGTLSQQVSSALPPHL